LDSLEFGDHLPAGGKPARAETFQVATGLGSWNSTSSWLPASIPNAVGATATFNGRNRGENPAQTGNRTINLDGPKTVGAIVFNTDISTYTNTISNGTAGPLIFNQTGNGPATILTTGVGTGNNTIIATMSFVDNVVATVDNISATATAGSLNLTGAISGAGGFSKNGDGLATFASNAKTYTGPTVLGGGRMRIALASAPTATSSLTVTDGGQLTMITSASTYTFGPGSLFLNGSGPITGPFAAEPGAIRQDPGIVTTIANPIVLQSNTVIHVQAAPGTGTAQTPTGSLTLTGSISGSGLLTFTAPGSDIDQGLLIIANDNSYTGGTVVAGGILRLINDIANLGTGDVTVSNATSPTSVARLSITAGVLDAIADTAKVTLTGGGTFGTADQSYIDLATGINEIVGGLVLGSTDMAPGTYGSTTSSADFKSDEFFAGAGILTVIPEPGSAMSLLAGCAALGLARRRRR
jgi:autotransporter-associated beta strand protein